MAVNGKGVWSAIVVAAIAFFLIGSAQAGTSAGGAAVPVLKLEAAGEVRIGPDGLLEERLIVPESLRSALSKAPQGAVVTISGWPVGVGDRRTVNMKRVQVYAPGARIFEVASGIIRQIPRSQHIHFVGEIDGERESGVLIIVDPASGEMSGLSMVNGLSFDMIRVAGGAPDAMRVVSTHERHAGNDHSFDCGGDSLDLPAASIRAGEIGRAATSSKAAASLEAVLAIDTDTELLSEKFSNNTASAADYVADLIAAMNVMYSRDLDVTLLQGTTYLRTGSDPYTQNSGSSASSSELNEFGNYWKSNYGSVDRALAAMLSGKSTSNYSASGIAWVGGLCSSNIGYSFSKVFKANYLSGDAKLVGHELGHNFGSPHTHCYSPPIDHCYNQGGCYSGSTSCPSGGPGTLMSYCHITGCGSTLDFHPTAVNLILTSHVNPATGVCIFEASDPVDQIFLDGFDSGGLGAWSTSQ